MIDDNENRCPYCGDELHGPCYCRYPDDEQILDSPYNVPLVDQAEIGWIIRQLQQLQAEGVTHVHCYNPHGQLERVARIGPERTCYDDGAAVGVTMHGEILGPIERHFDCL